MARMKAGFLLSRFSFWPWVWLCLLPARSWAQNTYAIQMQIPSEEEVQPRVGEDFTIEVQLTAQSRRGSFPSQFYRDYTPPSFPAGLTVVDRSESTRSSVAIVNGRYTQELSHVMTYVVRPTQAGKIVIGPASMEADGKLYRSNGLEIQVAPPRAAPRVLLETQEPEAAGIDDEFFQVTVDRDKVYVGQPVRVSWWLYTTSRLTERPQSDPPDSPGFFSKSLFSQNHTYEMERVQLGSNVFYRTMVFRRMYWPQRAGKLVIAPRTVAYRTRSGFLNTGKTETRTSSEVALDVKPLPTTGRPADFVDDHVGKFRIRMDLASTSLKVGDAVDLTVTLEGEALMTACRGPAMPSLDWARIEPNGSPAISETIENEERVRGEWKGRYVFIATREGSHTFPALSFSYFDPEEERYKTIQTNPVPVTVAPAPAGAAKLPPPGTRTPSKEAQANVLAPRLKPPAVGPVAGSSLRARFWEGSWRWGAAAAPFLLWLGTALVMGVRRRLATDVEGLRRRAARGRRREAIARVKAALRQEDAEAFHAECARLLLDLLSDVIGHPAAGCVHAKLREELVARGVPEELAKAVLEMLEGLDFARYAPGSLRAGMADRNSLWKEIQELMHRLEAYVK